MITLIGNVNLDLVMGTVAPWPEPGTEIIVPHSEWRAGGAAGNSALALAALGADFELIGNRGDDEFGQWLARAFGDRASRWLLSKKPTALSVGITHPDGERTFFSSLGHLEDYSYEFVLQQIGNNNATSSIALVSGTFVTPGLTSRYDELFEALSAQGYQIALDTGWPSGGWTDALRAKVLGWCSQVDLLMFNEVEARGIMGEPTISRRELAAKLQNVTKKNASVIIKCGADGAVLHSQTEYLECHAPKIVALDTIGAGDIFNAAFLFASQSGKPAELSLRFAIETATRAVSTLPRIYC